MNIVIAGATRNIGRIIARALTPKYRLLLTYRGEEKKRGLAQKRRSSFNPSQFVPQKNFF